MYIRYGLYSKCLMCMGIFLGGEGKGILPLLKMILPLVNEMVVKPLCGSV